MRRDVGRTAWAGRLASLIPAAALGLTSAGCGGPEEGLETGAWEDAEYREVLEANVDLLYGLMSVERYSPPQASRILAYAYTALYEGWTRARPDLGSLEGRLNELEGLPEPEEGALHDGLAVALAAQEEVLERVMAGAQPFSLHEIESFRAETVERRAEAGVERSVLDRSEEYGRELGRFVAAWAEADGYHERHELVEYEPGTHAGAWVPTADHGMSVSLNDVTQMVQLFEEDEWREVREEEELRERWLSDRMLHFERPETITDPNEPMEPGWRYLRPFVLESAQEVQPDGPVPYSEEPGSPFHQQAMAVYEASQDIDEDHVATGHYWSDLPGETGTPAGHWIKIAVQAAQQNDVPFEKALQAVTFTAVAFADAFIACWETKYATDVVRPVTYIRRHIDPEWVPVIVTPPFPEYTAGHATQSFAAAQTLTELLGDLAFTDHTHARRYGFEPRRYESFLEAAEEASLSRLHGGIHYPMGLEDGDWQGQEIGRRTAERLR